ncbi:DUF1349 domain-containing protein [bacterium]|nr:DUF1349 domain-containing protein [bacterium]
MEKRSKDLISLLGLVVGILGLAWAIWIYFNPTSGEENSPDPPPVTLDNIYIEDKFDSTLRSEWEWVDPAGDSKMDLKKYPGKLHLSTSNQQHNLYEVYNFDAPRLLLSSMHDNFSIVTQVKIPQGKNYQGAGLLLWQNNRNYVRLEFAHGFTRTGPHLLWCTHGNHGGGDERDAPGSSYLKLTKTGTSVRAAFSENGVEWKEIGSVIYIRTDLPMKTGLALVNGTEGEWWSADFDFFTMKEP